MQAERNPAGSHSAATLTIFPPRFVNTPDLTTPGIIEHTSAALFITRQHAASITIPVLHQMKPALLEARYA
jgi:hypothetical protein